MSTGLLARGRYLYSRDGQRQPVIEPWSLQQVDGALLLSGQRIVDGVSLLEVSARYRGRRCEQFVVHWNGAVPRHAEYQLHQGGLRWKPAAQAAWQAAPEADGSLLFPLIRAAAGPLLPLLEAQPRGVCVPDIRDPDQAQQFLRPLVSQRRAELIEGADGAARQYRYYGGEYGDAGADYWVDSHELLTRYQWVSTSGSWEVVLEELDVAEGFKGFELTGP